MEFETHRIFHIYNRGNNSQTIFFNRENYFYFLKKIKQYIFPYGNILAWCLLPNHFHIMLEVICMSAPLEALQSQGLTQQSLTLNRGSNPSQALTNGDLTQNRGLHPSQALTNGGLTQNRGLTSSQGLTKERTLNDAIGIMLRTYTRAIQKQEKRTGALFQKKTKAICVNDPKIEPAYYNTASGIVINSSIHALEYLVVCFNYIHKNPVHHHLVQNLCDWEFSSYPDYYCNRSGQLLNKERANELGLIQ